ncbi:J domain-containing protein required for chloroplast accumulation response 1 isoform X2 [Cornus florida]|uniref:J domain-containing protein required for chloroplast accumulation response 1 isoform X2 n=1 Tax=Cornus florida TaxID=4283 RepID=UPI00289E33DC|nr:J domain-containing protein required for chloroplast accumulation response 1 isoform X2 [Cornus florida]
MERFNQSANVLVNYSTQRSFRNPNSASKMPDVDFCDVFGGPPRRYSTQETRYSFGESAADSSRGGEDVVVWSASPWSGLSEKPVFGDESVNRRRHTSDDFFDDIFRGDESYSSPRRSAPDPLRSRVLSPARPLPPPKAESSNSIPSQFSLPAELTKAMDFSAHGSGSRSPYKYKDGTSNGISFPYTPSTSLSRFSSKAIQGQHEFINEIRPSYCQRLSNEFSLSSKESSYMVKSDETDTGGNLKKVSSSVESPSTPLSRFSSQAIQGQDEFKNEIKPSYRHRLSNEFSLSSKESSYMVKSDETDRGVDLKTDSISVESPSSCNQFHFSIYKWASKGVPLPMPLRGGNGLKLKEDGKFERCSSSNGRIGSHSLVNELQTQNSESSKMEGEKQENVSFPKRSNQNGVESCENVKETVFDMSESRYLNSFQSTVENVSGDVTLSDEREETKPHSLPAIGLSEKMVKENSAFTQEAHKPDFISLRSLLKENNEGQEIDKLSIKDEEKGPSVKMAQVKHSNVDATKTVKKHDGKKIKSKKAEVSKASLESRPINSGDNPGKNGVKGKVKEFVKIFNQEASSKSKINVDTRQSSRWKGMGTYRADNEANVHKIGTDGKKHMLDETKIRTLRDAPVMVNENIEQLDEQHSYMKTRIRETSDNYFGPNSASAWSFESLHGGFKDPLGIIDEPFQDNYLIKELSHEEDKLLQTGKDDEDIQVLDAKIRQWSNGKAGNIRSLLSTLQYILWPESGWKPVPLVDIIEGSAVKRAYQKALLCLHPDKLQQKGAASHQKYIAEKVFDILQEAWDHFNSSGSL